MGELLGADPSQLRELAKEALRGREKLGSALSTVTGALLKAGWQGHDAQRFRSVWNSQHRPTLQRAATELENVATMLQKNADEQEKASAADGGPSHAGRGDGNPRDLPGDPGPADGMGDYEPLPSDIPFDDGAIDPNNIAQGQLGDCWFLAAAGAVAKNDPAWIRDHVSKNDDGTWTVTMYRDGKPVLITVEPTVPVHSVKGSNGEPSWLSIYEKAAAEYFGGDYEDLDGGFSDEGLEAITGRDTHRSGESNFDDIEQLLKDGPVALGTEGDRKHDWYFWEDEVDDNRVVPNHAYIVDKFENRVNPDTGDTERMIHVINPWGPEGGNLAGDKNVDGKPQRWGDLWLTEDQYKENFDSVYSSDSTKK